MRYLLITICCVCIFYPLFHYERTKYKHALYDCSEAYGANMNLLKENVCKNLHNRIRYKDAGTVDCDKAERETRLMPRQCALNKWWLDTIIGTYWSVLPILLFAMYLYYKRSVHIWSETQFYGKYIKKIGKRKRKRLRLAPIMEIN